MPRARSLTKSGWKCGFSAAEPAPLVRPLGRLPELRQALESGHIDIEAAGFIARIANQEAIDAWIDRAARRTVKHLAEEIRFFGTLKGEMARDFDLTESAVRNWVEQSLVDSGGAPMRRSSPRTSRSFNSFGACSRNQLRGPPMTTPYGGTALTGARSRGS